MTIFLIVHYSERIYIVFMVKGILKIVRYFESSLNPEFVKPREFIKKLLVRI